MGLGEHFDTESHWERQLEHYEKHVEGRKAELARAEDVRVMYTTYPRVPCGHPSGFEYAYLWDGDDCNNPIPRNPYDWLAHRWWLDFRGHVFGDSA